MLTTTLLIRPTAITTKLNTAISHVVIINLSIIYATLVVAAELSVNHAVPISVLIVRTIVNTDRLTAEVKFAGIAVTFGSTVIQTAGIACAITQCRMFPFIICLILMNYLMEFYFIGFVNAHLPGCFCPWTFRLNIGLNTSPSDSFVSYLNSHLGYSAGEFQALQLIVLAVFGAVD